MSADPPISTTAINGTSTLVFALDVRNIGLVTLQVQNLDALQTFSGFLWRKVAGGLDYSASTMPDFSSISPAGAVDGQGNPLDSVTADIDVEGSAELVFVGLMSGAGGDISWSVRKAGPKR
jgi:hypothetical protein